MNQDRQIEKAKTECVKTKGKQKASFFVRNPPKITKRKK